jgi:Na+/melibiose symporter-like transporter
MYTITAIERYIVKTAGLLNRAGYHGYSIAAATLMFVSILISTAGTHRYIPYLRAAPPKRAFNLSRDSREIRDALANRPFLSMIACGFFSAMALGLVATLSIYFHTYYCELSADQVSPAAVLRSLALAYVPLIVVLLAISIFCIRFYRIGRAAHNSNLALLHAEQRKA